MNAGERKEQNIGLAVIAALSTPAAPAGIGVIRVSGDEAVAVADRVFRPAGNRALHTLSGYQAAFGHVFDEAGDIDECVALVFRAPHSYTGEDTVELSCHGGLYGLRRVLRALYAAGARPAEAGEFTRRAFLNGKMDLTGAEAVMDLIGASGRLAAKTALAAREGRVFEQVEQVRNDLLSAAAQFSAFVDYPDEDIPELTEGALSQTLQNAEKTLTDLLSTFDAGRVLREGVDTAIVGSPNVGKSTLMNLLAGCERSIVTPVAGTTRDIVEETVVLGEVTLRLADTAGLHDTADTVEAIGVEKARKRLKDAALILAVFDGTSPLTDDDRALILALDREHTVAIVNKTDRDQRIELDEIKAAFPYTVTLSAATGDGTKALSEAVENITGVARLQEDAPVLASERQRECVTRALSAVREGMTALAGGMTLDAVSVCVDGAIGAILSLTGERTSDRVVDEVFRRFCVGK
ncbi:MAG: tRNA uridine-5-carboxymethylaminomethyl(34) synthesis GTPase MnmE [Clostridia bacterium]|nr:tRNA uridine-5-carboxymethylaminomethyl(34) synthesis GTPase MnmE [Clostridia bacterium]